MSKQCKIALFYRYVHIEDVKSSRDWFANVCRCQNLQGRILIASEGINGTVAGFPQQVDEFVNIVSTDVRFQHIDWKFSLEQRDKLPFPDLHIRESLEIVSSGRDGISPQNVKFSEDSFGGLSKRVFRKFDILRRYAIKMSNFLKTLLEASPKESSENLTF